MYHVAFVVSILCLSMCLFASGFFHYPKSFRRPLFLRLESFPWSEVFHQESVGYFCLKLSQCSESRPFLGVWKHSISLGSGMIVDLKLMSHYCREGTIFMAM